MEKNQDDGNDAPQVMIEIRPTGPDGRLISGRDVVETLSQRIGDVQRGIEAGVVALASSLPQLPRLEGWGLSTVEAKFGVTLGYEGSVIISTIAAEASFEVTVTFERGAE